MTPTRRALLDRERELELLSGALAAACAGRPGFAVVAGEAGIGKTRLLDELADLAVARGCLTLAGRAAEFERGLPFGLLIDALDDYLRSLDASVLDRLAIDRLGALAAVFPSLRSLGEAVEHPVSATERFRLHQAVRELVERLAAQRAVVLILDDLQWADGASIELIASLLRRPPQAAVMVGMGLRTSRESAAARAIGELERAGAAEMIELGPLSRDSVRLLVGDADGAEFDQIHHESGGNPFYALELVRSGMRDGPVASGVAGTPSTVARAIASELDALTRGGRELAQAAAVVGDPFELDLAAAASGGTEEEMWEHVDELVASDLVRPTHVPRRFQFRHPLVRNAIYGSCPPSVRVACHTRAADALLRRGAPATTLARHVEQSARHGDAVAIELLRRAGEETAGRAPTSAALWFAAAARLLPHDAPAEEQISLLTSLAGVLTTIGRFGDAHRALERCIAAVPPGEVELRVGLIVDCAVLEQLLGRHQDARARLVRAYDELVDVRSPAGVSLLIALSANSLYLSDYAAMLDWGRLAVEAADAGAGDSRAAAALAAYTMGAAFAGRIELARELHGRTAHVIDALGDDVLARRLDALSNLATAELYLDLYAGSCRHGERGLDLARATGQTQLLPILTPILGCSLWMIGETARSAEVLDEAIEAARLAGNTQALSASLFNRALSASMAGDIGTALELGAESVELAREVDNGVISAFAGAIHAQALLESGDAAAALDLLLSSGGGPELPLLAGGWRATYLELLTRCQLELGRREEARAAARLLRTQADALELGLPRLMADRADAAVALADGNPHAAVEPALSAVATAERIGARAHAAASRHLAGRALGAAGRQGEAIEQLERAAAEFEAMGALRYRDQADSQLRKLGRPVHRRTRPGVPGSNGVALLTGRELEVAERVLERRTNREIAGELFLSLKTVETHMRNIFNKLGVSSRGEVAQVLARARTP